MKYHIVKSTRMDNGFPYTGPTNVNAGIEPKFYEDLDEAITDCDILFDYNITGFEVYDSV